MSDALVIIPTYNEKENIENIINAIHALSVDFHVLVVDDGSPDGTASIVRKIQEKQADKLFLLERSGKLGLGTAYIAGFKWGLKKSYKYFIEMDADFSHPPKDLVNLYSACHEGGADASIGSRYVKGGGVKNWPYNRLLLSFGASLYVRMITWMNIKDPTAGFVCYTRQVLETLDLDKIRFVGYAFQIEMKYAVKSLGFKMVEVPIIFTDREFGDSKMNSSIVSEAVIGVLKMRINSFFRSYRRTSS